MLLTRGKLPLVLPLISQPAVRPNVLFACPSKTDTKMTEEGYVCLFVLKKALITLKPGKGMYVS